MAKQVWRPARSAGAVTGVERFICHPESRTRKARVCSAKTPSVRMRRQDKGGLTGDQQALENGRDGFLLPSFQLLASLLEQLEVGFDPPTPVVPEGNLDIGNRAGQVAQQEPVGQRFPVRGTVRLTINKCTVRGTPGIGGTRCPCSLSRLGLAGRTMVTSALASHCTAGFP